MNLKNKVAVITGSTGGIGRLLVEELDRQGMTCVLVGKNEEKLMELSKSLKSRKKKYYPADFSIDHEISEVSKKVAKDLSRIDLLVNLAGIGVYKLIEDVTMKEWDDSFSI